MTDRIGHVYKLIAIDGHDECLYLVIRKNQLSHTCYGQLWDVLDLEHGNLEDEWEDCFANPEYYELVS